MDELIPALFILIATVAGIFSSAKKEKERKAAAERHKAAAAARVQAAQQKMQSAAKPQSTKAAVPPRSFSNVPGQVITPTVHTHIQPDCDVHDAQGSLNFASTEGKDPCHEDELTMERSLPEAPAQAGSLTFDWTGDSMVKAVVMQEVLTRPAQRAALRQSR